MPPTTFGFETTTDEALEGIDLTGKTVLVTGASTGLGEETTRALASKGARVIMAARDAEKLKSLPAEEAQRWQTFWGKVRKLLAKLEGKPSKEK